MIASPIAGAPWPAPTPSANGTAVAAGSTSAHSALTSEGGGPSGAKSPPPLSLLVVGVASKNGFKGKGASEDLNLALAPSRDRPINTNASIGSEAKSQEPSGLQSLDQNPSLIEGILPAVLQLQQRLAQGAKAGPYALWEKPAEVQDGSLHGEEAAASQGIPMRNPGGSGSGWALGATDDDAMAYAADEALLSNLRAKVPTQLNKDIVADRRVLEGMYARARAAVRALPPQPARSLAETKHLEDNTSGDQSEETTAQEARELTEALEAYEEALRRAAQHLARVEWKNDRQ
ncbi:hypothetical protein CBOM_05435 [Ceraceosorus bombacis]|uniref:Uncharacterized protein n=1 Tax=Ceraceosorus bombacis TaxID=401625 RepID=A0A0P1BQV6_9BASI|nr:hypothetical protein CBOM_05435 [Ceraceosorus bombacis]